MKAKRRDFQIFSLSFLDILSCALGGVLLMLLLQMDNSNRRSASYQREMAGMQMQMDKTLSDLEDVKNALQDEKAESEALGKAKESLQRAQLSLIGVKGDLKRVVFVFDTSGSMKNPRFDEYKQMLKGWIEHLPMSQFDVIDYDSTIKLFQPDLVDASDENRQEACRFIDRFEAEGATDTLGALQKAFELGEVDTIILMSDGAPTCPHSRVPGLSEQQVIEKNIEIIEEWLKTNNASRSITINCVAMGNYFNTSYGEFLQRVALDHHGIFIGR